MAENDDDDKSEDKAENEKGREGEQDDGNNGDDGRDGILEKIFTIFSLLLIMGLAGFLIWKSFGTPTPAAFKVEPHPAEKRGDFIGIEVTVHNTGEETAKAVQVMGEATGAEGKKVEAQATLDWLPGRSKRNVTLIFPAGTDVNTAEIKVAGYEDP